MPCHKKSVQEELMDYSRCIKTAGCFLGYGFVSALITTTARKMMQMRNYYRHVDSRQFLYAVLGPLWLVLGLTMQPTVAAAVSLTPIVPGVFTDGDGVSSHWVQVRNTAIDSLQDATSALGLTSSDADFLRSADAVLGNINVGNDVFNQRYDGTLGAVNLAPLFNTGDSNQENYAGHMWGYLSVPTAGNYNFEMLYDDGFEFTIWGANTFQRLSVDGLAPRISGNGQKNRLDFASALAMGAGLYRYDLVGYNGPRVHALRLGWSGPTSDFDVIPQAYLYTSGKGASVEAAYYAGGGNPFPSAVVPVPAAVWLFGSGLMGLIGLASRRKRNTK
jgi:hypothetical protein